MTLAIKRQAGEPEMDQAMITALAKGLVPYVREVVSTELAGQMLVPPDLAEKVRAAARMLEEEPAGSRETLPQSPSLVSLVMHEVERQLAMVRRVTGALVTRGGELALTYSDGGSDRLGPVIGPPGAQGPPGPCGRDGKDGVQGETGAAGPRGRDGISVVGSFRRDGELMLTLSDGTVLAA